MLQPPGLTNKAITDIISLLLYTNFSDRTSPVLKYRGKNMKKVGTFSLFLAIVLIFSSLGISAEATQANPAVTDGCHSLDAEMTLSDETKLTATANAVVLYEMNSGTMIYTRNPDEKIYPTSMVKMMTALVAMENGDLDDVVTVTRKVLNQVPIGILGAGLQVGEEITLRDLLYSTMVESATDSAVVVAAHIGGSVEGFVQMMNAKAAELGCLGTHYSNVHGLHDANTYTTARDIARLTVAALENETFRAMFETARYTMSPTNKRPEGWTITTTNHMINSQNKKYYDKRITGGKTGATDQGGRCLTVTAEQDGMRLLCVVMGAKPTVAENGSLSAHGSFEESKILVDYAFENFEFRQVFFEGQSLEQYPVSSGSSHVVSQAAYSVSTVMPLEIDETKLKWVYQESGNAFYAPIEKGQGLGVAQVWYGNKCLAQTEMVAMNAVAVYKTPVVPDKPGYSSDTWLVVLLVLLGIAFAVCVALSLRTLKVMQHKRRHKKRSTEQ